MSRDQVKTEVEQLKAEVEQSVMLTDEQKGQLGDLANRLELAAEGEHPVQELVDRLEQHLLEYEESHPLLARIMDNVINALHSMGI